MRFNYLFDYPHTLARLLTLIIIFMLVNFKNISSFEDVLVNLGGAIFGSGVAEIVLRLIFKAIIRD
jgi:hypothetical protein